MKRILSWVLAMVLLLSYMPAGAVQAESLTQTVQPQPVQEVAAPEETPAFTAVSAVAAEPESLDNRQLLEGYAYSLFYGQIATFGRKAGDRLTGDEKLIYDALVPIIQQIAAGERTSTVIGLGQTVSDQNGNQYVADAEVTFTGKSLDNAALQRILSALLTDLPYDLYWYDKVTGAKSISLAPPDGILVHFQLTLAVADNYQGSGEYTVDSAEARAAVAAAEKSAAILAKYASASDYEKLLGYKEEICSLVTYDRTAADAGNFSLDDDPWQLIHVFDGNTATNVVCEGYSKAFMYLCQQTAFAGDVSCITVTGIMGGAHMWNIVTLEGKNYLVDVTNSEPGTVGADGSLFLAGGTGSVLSGYTVGDEFYSYMDKAEGTDPDIALWGSDASSILTLEEENYTPKTTNIVASGTCGDNLTWTLDNAGTLAISGTGAMDDYYDDRIAPWYFCCDSIKHVVIDDGVTSIGDDAFEECTNLITITIPNSVSRIGDYAFNLCTSLTEILIPNSVTSIGGWAFGYCTSLTNIIIPSSVTTIADHTFLCCSNLTSVTIPDSITDVGLQAFFGCINLSYNIYNNGKYLGNINNPYMVLVEPITKSITSCEIHTNTNVIAKSAFSDCTSLRNVTIGNSVEVICNSAFYNCTGLIGITIPDSVTTIGDWAFEGCTSLKDVYYSATKTLWQQIGIGENNECLTKAEIHYTHTIINHKAAAPTCTKPGWKAYETCECCDYTTYVEIPATGHSYTAKVTAPTCTAKGYTTHTCSCGDSYKDTYVNALGHQMGSWTTTKAATCTATGTKTQKCTRCSYSKTESISKTAHKYTSKVVKPTPTAKGYTLHTCACGNSYKDTYTPALNLSAPKVSISLNATTGKQVLTWKSGGDGISYQIYRASSKKGKYSKVGTAKTDTWTDTSASVGKTYYYKVKAVYDDRSSSFSNIVSKAAVCGTPDVTVTLKKGKPYISWKKVTSAKKYEVYYATSKTGKYKKLTTTTSKSYTHSKASTGSQYFYKVRAVGSKSSYTGSYSAIESCWVTCVAPTVTASNDATTGYPILKWKAVTGAKKYDVYRRVAGKGEYVKIGSTSGKSYTDKSAVANTKYDYQVQTVGKKTQLNSPMSDKDTILCKVAAPVITVKLNAEGKPVISWKAVKGAKSYKVYRSTKATKSYKKLSGGELDVKNGTYTDTTADGGKTYYYKVVAVGSGNESGYSNYKKATAKCSIPALKVKLSSNKPVLSWKKVGGAKKYEIQYSTDGKNFKKLTTTNKTSYTHKASAGTYYYKIKALGSKSSYNGSFSAPIKAVVKK